MQVNTVHTRGKNAAGSVIFGSNEQAGDNSLPYLLVKRGFDITCSLLAFFLFLPLMLVTALLIKLEDGGPVFYLSRRISRDREFVIYKFRSMVTDSHRLEKYFSPEQKAQYLREMKLGADPRVTKIGRLIRRACIDELPQLINILKGDMSIVGPRPVIREELDFYAGQQADFCSVRPGLTGYWQISGRDGSTYESGKRQQLELFYIRNRSILLDLRIIFKTFGVVLKGLEAE